MKGGFPKDALKEESGGVTRALAANQDLLLLLFERDTWQNACSFLYAPIQAWMAQTPVFQVPLELTS